MSWLLNNPIGDRWHETVRHYAELYSRDALSGKLSRDQLFEIAAVLVRSNCSSYTKLAIDILEHLSTSVDSKVTHKSYLIYLTIGYIRLNVFDLAHNCLKQIKIIDPNCRQGIELEACLQKQRVDGKFKERRNNVSSVKSANANEDEDRDESELMQLLESTRFSNSS